MKWLLRVRPHLLAACVCFGLAASNLGRDASVAVALIAVGGALTAIVLPAAWRLPALGFALALAGWWWGSVRLDALDRSPLMSRVGTAERALVVVTGPARRSPFDLRVPAQMRHFGDAAIGAKPTRPLA